MRTVITLCLLGLMAGGSGCSGSDDNPDTRAADATPGDATDVMPDAPPDALDVVDDAGFVDNEWGFPMRLPKEHAFTCTAPWGSEETFTWLDADWVCTFDVGDLHGHVYVQSTPAECVIGMTTTPGYAGVAGWISSNGEMFALGDPGYDWGGNHHNESIAFDWNGRRYVYYHSSFGAGWRACHGVDCIRVYMQDGTLENDGCTSDRTLPAVCVRVDSSGGVGALVDTFEKCPGDDGR